MKIDAKLPPTRPAPQVIDVNDPTWGLGPVIKEIRQQRGVTQIQLAGAVGLERTSICNIERGKQALSVTTLVRIADALGMELTIKLTPHEDTK